MVVSGPSGSGKSTLIARLLEKNPGLTFAVSHTTRSRRRAEQHGREYYFVDETEFNQMIAQNQFLEWARVHSHLYGTSFKEIKSKSEGEGMLVLDLDVQGARNIKIQFPRAVFVLIIPPSIGELKKRLLRRKNGQDHSEIDRRLSVACEELSHYSLYDYVVINDHIESAFSQLQCITVALTHQIGYYKDIIEQFIRSCK